MHTLKEVSLVISETTVQPRSDGSKSIRVLMADADESVGSFYSEPLSQDGFEVVTASSGVQCIARLRERAPDVLVLEPQLPWGGGDGVLAMMCGIPALAAIPVMVLTSCRDLKMLAAMSRFAIGDYQWKPLTSDRLAERLRSLLARPSLHFTMAEQNSRLECSITRRTDGRVRDLRVETTDGRVVVRGRSESHHVKQLALAAVLESLEASRSPSESVEVEIEVAPSDGRQVRRYALSQEGKERQDEFTLAVENDTPSKD
jgi:DNA-binding response OmpR family regulator